MLLETGREEVRHYGGQESGTRRPTLELLLPLARAYGVTLDELVDAPPTGDPRIHLLPVSRGGLARGAPADDAGAAEFVQRCSDRPVVYLPRPGFAAAGDVRDLDLTDPVDAVPH